MRAGTGAGEVTDILPDPGGKIDRPGAYRLTMERYHDPHLCVGPSVSSSGLRTIETKSAGDFWAFSGLNGSAFEKVETAAFNFGKAAHALLLGDEDFDAGYVVSPYDGFRSKEAREWREAQTKVIVSPDDMDHIKGMSASLKAHGLPDLIFGGEPEVSLIWRDHTGVWIKARPDALPATGDLGDLKTTTDNELQPLMRGITKYSYDMQMALCVEGMEKVLHRSPTGVVIIYAQKKPPYTVTPISIGADALYWGKVRNRRAINTFAECWQSGEWPFQGDRDISEYQLPEWLAARLSEEQSDGRLPNDEDLK